MLQKLNLLRVRHTTAKKNVDQPQALSFMEESTELRRVYGSNLIMGLSQIVVSEA